MRRLVILLAALVLAAPAPSQVVGTTPSIAGGSVALAPLATPVAPPTLPIAAAAKVEGFGHSFNDRMAGTSATVPGVQLFARGVLPYVDALERADARAAGVVGRFNVDICYDESGTRQVQSAATRLSCADQGFNGDVLSPIAGNPAPGTLMRSGYAASRGPQIVYLDIGINDVRAGRTAAQVIADLDQQVAALTSRGIWVVIQTLVYPRDGSYDYSAVPTINAWIIAQAGRTGVKVADTTALDGTATSPAGNLGGDLLHLSPAGARARALVVWPILQAMVSPSTTAVVTATDAANNLWALRGQPGTSGTLTNATGVSATGYNLTRTTGASGYVGSKRVIATGNECQVITVAPSGTGVGSFSLRPTTQYTYTALGLVAGDWYELGVTVTLDSWAGWEVASGDTQTAALYAEGYDSTLATAYSLYSSFAGMPGRSVRLTIKGKVPGSGDRFRWSNRLAQVFHRQDVTGTGVAEICEPVLRKTTDPRTAWLLP